MKKRPRKPKKLARKRSAEPPSAVDLASVEKEALRQIADKQKKGKRLTAADYDFMADYSKHADLAQSANVLQMPPRKLTFAQKFQAMEDDAISALHTAMKSSSAVAATMAAKIVLDKLKQEAPPTTEKVNIHFNVTGEEEKDERTA